MPIHRVNPDNPAALVGRYVVENNKTLPYAGISEPFRVLGVRSGRFIDVVTIPMWWSDVESRWIAGMNKSASHQRAGGEPATVHLNTALLSTDTLEEVDELLKFTRSEEDVFKEARVASFDRLHAMISDEPSPERNEGDTARVGAKP